MSTIILTTGVPGSGKTYVRCARFLVDDFLVNTRGIHISNFPLDKKTISEFVAKKINSRKHFYGYKENVSSSDIAFRIEIIPDDVLQLWRSGLSGPWDYFSGRDLKYCHIAIDEIHNFVNPRCSSENLKQWDDFLGEIRHRGCTFEGLTQDITAVDQVLTGRASIRYELVPAEDLRDPFFKIPLSDWYQLKASLLHDFHKTVFVLEKRKTDSRWKTNHTYRFLILPEYFCFYDSYNASLQEKENEHGKGSESRAPLQEYERRSRTGMLIWFFSRHFFTFFFRISLACFLFWLCFCGGLNFFIKKWLTVTRTSYKSNSSSKVTSVPPETVPAGTVPAETVPAGTVPAGTVHSQSFYTPKNLDELKYLDEKKENLENGYKPALFFDRSCWLRNGIRITTGYVFKDHFEGKKVVKIDPAERCYILDDDTIVSMF